MTILLAPSLTMQDDVGEPLTNACLLGYLTPAVPY